MIYKILIPILLFTSCSLIKRTRESLLGKEAQKGKDAQSAYVSREEYNKLLKKYEATQKDNVSAKDDPYKDRELGVHQMIDDMNGVGGKQFETVDFDNKTRPAKPIAIGDSEIDVEAQIVQTQNAIATFHSGDLKSAKSQFASLINSPIEQVGARSAYYLGLIHFRQKQYSAALPFFEKVINEYGFSVLAVKSLNYAVNSSLEVGDAMKANNYKKMSEAFGGFANSVMN